MEFEERNNQLIKEYLNSKESENTIKSYRSDIKLFTEYIKKSLMEVTVADVVAYFNTIKDKSNATYNRKLIAIRDLFNYFIYTGEYNKNNPTGRTKRMKTDTEGKTEPLTLEQARELIKLIKEKIKKANSDFYKRLHIRNLAVIHSAINSGCRISEILELTLDRLDLENKQIILRGDDTKGKKERIIDLPDKSIEYLNSYLEIRDAFLKGKECDCVFLTKSGKMLDYGSFDDILKDYGEEIDMPELRSHQFRATYITNYFNSCNGNLLQTNREIQHASLSTTARYIKTEKENNSKSLPTARL